MKGRLLLQAIRQTLVYLTLTLDYNVKLVIVVTCTPKAGIVLNINTLFQKHERS